MKLKDTYQQIDNRLQLLNDPWIRMHDLILTPPSLGDNTADADRLIRKLSRDQAMDHVVIPISLIRDDLPSRLRACDFKVKVIGFEDMGIFKIINITSIDDHNPFLGIVIDLGTSTVVLRLIDLFEKRIIKEISFLNPQNQIGADILTRIQSASDQKGRKPLGCSSWMR